MKKPSLTQKLFLGYLLMVALTVFVGIYAVVNFDELRRINQGVVETDLPLIEAVRGMIDTLTVQDLYARKYAILVDQTTEGFFWSRGAEFDQWLSNPAFRRGSDPDLQKRLHQLHEEYNGLFSGAAASIAAHPPAGQANELLDGPLKAKMDEQIRLLRQIEHEAREDQRQKLLLTNQRSQESWVMTLVISLTSLAIGLGFASFATYRIGRSIRELKETARRIGQGEFDRLPRLEAEDVVGDLGESIRWMSHKLKEFGELKLDANPLTRLPGNLAVERELLARLTTQAPFAFCYVDLKDFKAFGDRYGYQRGSEVLIRVSQILVEAARVFGGPNDFVGHIGGDDFVLITEPSCVQALSERIIREFDHLIPSYYDEEDRKRGFIVSKDRKNKEEIFPIMTISIAVVTNERAPILKTNEVAELAAELKLHAKSFQRSAYVFQKER
jgi:diguanylate cyclase (GGDEF)-like protein